MVGDLGVDDDVEGPELFVKVVAVADLEIDVHAEDLAEQPRLLDVVRLVVQAQVGLRPSELGYERLKHALQPMSSTVLPVKSRGNPNRSGVARTP